ncbi:MAG: hypothetical protein GF344_17365 [Chitinivibrionales bacterium]|nr:hypothetical protein [Chitinivibrionales bacterium]
MRHKKVHPIPPEAPGGVRKAMVCTLILMGIALLTFVITALLSILFKNLAVFEYAKDGATFVATGATATYLMLFVLFTQAFATIGKVISAFVAVLVIAGVVTLQLPYRHPQRMRNGFEAHEGENGSGDSIPDTARADTSDTLGDTSETTRDSLGFFGP